MKNKKQNPVRVLHIVGAMYPGGMGNYIMNLYRSIDRDKVQFDFIIHTRKEDDYVDLVREMGAHVYELPRLTKHPIKNLRMIRRIVRDNNISVVIRHTANALVTPQLLAAKLGGAVTICHSHSTTDPQETLHSLGQRLMRISTDERWACSEAAGRWMYGELEYRVINNAIDVDEFSYETEKRLAVRKELLGGVSGLEDALGLEDASIDVLNSRIYGHVGNLSEVKNHTYLLKIFRKILDKDPNSYLVCVGEGVLRRKIEDEIVALGMENHVILTGIRRDVSSIMSAIDVLLFPSIYEGLPLTLIEAQAAGLPCIISDVITDDVDVTSELGLINKLNIGDDPSVWADMAVETISNDSSKVSRDDPRIRELIREHGYDLAALSAWFEEHMLEMAE